MPPPTSPALETTSHSEASCHQYDNGTEVEIAYILLIERLWNSVRADSARPSSRKDGRRLNWPGRQGALSKEARRDSELGLHDEKTASLNGKTGLILFSSESLSRH